MLPLPQVEVSWSAPVGEGNSYLSSYEVRLLSRTGHLLETRQRLANYCILNNLAPASEYAIALVAICNHVTGLEAKFNQIVDQIKEIRSEPLRASFVTPPRRPENLVLERSEPTSLRIRWESPAGDSGAADESNTAKITYIVTVKRAGESAAEPLEEKRTDSNVFTLSGLPASGVAYLVAVKAVVYHNAKALHSDTATAVFATRPHPPTELAVVDHVQQVL
jgi:hypothetical protein